MLKCAAALAGRVENVGPILEAEAGAFGFYNISPLDIRRLLDDPGQVAGNLWAYIAGFSSEAREVLDKFDFDTQIARLARADLLYMVVSKFADLDLHPDVVSNLEMGYLYEELIYCRALAARLRTVRTSEHLDLGSDGRPSPRHERRHYEPK